jgi:tRNA (guanine37-N1)-methyltransferase
MSNGWSDRTIAYAILGNIGTQMGRRNRIVSEALRDILPENELRSMAKGFDLVGDVAILRIPKSFDAERFLIAQALMNKVSYVKTVLRQVGAIEGDFRTRGLEWLCGENKTMTSHREHGCTFQVDLATTYFSPRLLYERTRIAELCKNSGEYENVLNMFSGVGCFSIRIAKQLGKRHVYSVDINPDAIKYQLKNIKSNRVKGTITVILGEAKQIIESFFQQRLHRILMPLPEKAYAYLDSAIGSVSRDGGTIHYYDFTHANKDEDPVKKVIGKIDPKLRTQPRHFSVAYGRVIRSTGPNWYQVVLDINVQ